MIVHNFDPVFIDFGIIEIRWYSLAYIFGILFGWWYGKRLITKQLEKKLIDLYTHKYDDSLESDHLHSVQEQDITKDYYSED